MTIILELLLSIFMLLSIVIIFKTIDDYKGDDNPSATLIILLILSWLLIFVVL